MDYSYLEELAKKWDFHELNHIVMTDTMNQCETDENLKSAIKKSNEKQYIINDWSNFVIKKIPGNTKIIVSKKRTYESAKKYKWKKIAVLDFANSHSVWWAPYYAWAQEESMCRCSTLFPCLNTEYNRSNYYYKHIEDYNDGILDNYWNNDIIYIPDVVVFKTDESIPRLLPKDDWYNVDVIVSAAPELWYYWNNDTDKYQSIMRERIKCILAVAKKENIEVLILWAFGCGAFSNPPKTVARLFKEELKNYDFEIVEFPVFCREYSPDSNYQIFKDILMS